MKETVILDKYIFSDQLDDEISIYIKNLYDNFLKPNNLRVLLVGLNYKGKKFYEMDEDREMFRMNTGLTNKFSDLLNLFFHANHLIKTLIKGHDISTVFIFNPFLSCFVPDNPKKYRKHLFLSQSFWTYRMNFLQKLFVKYFCLKGNKIFTFTDEERIFFEKEFKRDVYTLDTGFSLQDEPLQDKKYIIVLSEKSDHIKNLIRILDKNNLIKKDMILPKLHYSAAINKILTKYKVEYYSSISALQQHFPMAHTIINIDYVSRNDFLFNLRYLLKNVKIITAVEEYKVLSSFPNFYFVENIIQIKDALTEKTLKIPKDILTKYSAQNLAKELDRSFYLETVKY